MPVRGHVYASPQDRPVCACQQARDRTPHLRTEES